MQDPGYVPLVEVWRGDTVESVHFGAIAVVDAAGRTIGAAGDPETVTFLRSAAKPAQVLPLLESGAAERFGFTDEEVAVMIGSHGGEPFHVKTVRSILSKIGLDEGALQCGAHAPSYRPAAQDLRRRGRVPTAIHNNCSGKHAGMLALAVHLGAPVATYLEASHPVQRRIRATVEALAGLEPGGTRTATDGCSAPNFAMPLGRAARMFARLVASARTASGPRAASVERTAADAAPADDLVAAARRAVEAMRRHPEMIAGTDRLCTTLMQTIGHALIAKIGAEGFYGLGYEHEGTGIGIALKIADGDGQRARFSAALETLRQLGLLDQEAAAALRSRFVGDIRNHRGLTVGRVETVFHL